ncbi:hypothetical protein EXT68_02485 [Pectobacterium parmentieri]|uniref:DUF6387 family protein n=1 Tax=Pectobacterium TaxID=122277 RepID=UPI00202D2B0F|nr:MULTISPECIES: DUF6387 family protein [Pectobacterium]MCL6354382.1 hypothetical protein [Pectobacterium parmentieri]UUE37834.1 DUF6387 family protein [Pectobacterium aroidearum]UUE42209.1 DUF6387 family protein [Pectobacterium aroidearum]
MTKAEIAEAVKEWFNIENYSVLHDLTVEELFQEIENRIIVYRMESRLASMSYENRKIHDDYYDDLLDGKVIFGDIFEGPKKELSSSYAIEPITHKGLWEVAGYVAALDKRFNPEGKPLPYLEVSRYLKEAEANNNGLMLVQINLAETSSEEIINHLKVMVPEWKKQLQAPEPPARDFRFGVSNLKKILDYNIIPIMDLLFWAQGEDIRIGMPQLTSFLYPDEFKDGIRDVDKVKSTDHPLAISYLTDIAHYQSFVDFTYKYDDRRHWKAKKLIKEELGQG